MLFGVQTFNSQFMVHGFLYSFLLEELTFWHLASMRPGDQGNANKRLFVAHSLPQSSNMKDCRASMVDFLMVYSRVHHRSRNLYKQQILHIPDP